MASIINTLVENYRINQERKHKEKIARTYAASVISHTNSYRTNGWPATPDYIQDLAVLGTAQEFNVTAQEVKRICNVAPSIRV
jgi:hypothetical protein